MSSVLRPVADDPRTAFTAVATRRADARADRLLPVLATGCHDDCYWIAYEYGAATPLASEGWRRWPAPAALDLLAGVADAVDDAASHAVLAYELLPASVFIDPRIGPLLGDFGTAREAFGNAPFDEGRGAPFVPPEVATLGQAGARSGVYAAGALLYALLSGGPPRPEPVTHARSDLSDGINLVLARAMARDPLERYRTAAELCDSARRALGEEREAAEEQERPRQLQPAAPPPPRPSPRPLRAPFRPAPQLARPGGQDAERTADFEWRPPEPPFAQPFARPLRAAIVVAAVGLAAFAGLQLGASDAPASGAGSELLGEQGVSITLPPSWSAGVPRGDVVLSAYPTKDWFSGLSVRLGDTSVPAADRKDPVRLGQLDMWRDRGARLVSYSAPTTAGTLVASCEAASGAARNTLRLCERSISTLRLQGATVLPLSGVVAEPGFRAAATRLRRDRRTGRVMLARANTPGLQRKAAAAMARTYKASARRLAETSGGANAASAARRAASAYARLATAAAADSKRRWRAAAKSVRRAEAELAKQLAAGG